MSDSALIDVHAHFHTDDYVAAATKAGIAEPDGMPLWPQWSVADHLAMMNDNGIQRAVLSVSSPGVHFGDDGVAAELARHVNDFASTLVDRHPDRFGFFASLALPAVDAAVAEAGRALDSLGARGVIVMSNSAGQYLGDPALAPLWQLLNERQAICFVHPTSPPGAANLALGRPRPMVEFIFETTRTVTDMIFAGVIASYPDIRFLIPHCGAALPLLAERIELFRSLWPGPDGQPPGPLTTRTQLQRFWYDLAGFPLPNQARLLASTVGNERILYGSDFCWTPAAGVAQQISLLDGDPGIDWRAVTSANARQFFAAIASAAKPGEAGRRRQD
jgi:predicted TIM-barrel fold metal-dependent hydrolase